MNQKEGIQCKISAVKLEMTEQQQRTVKQVEQQLQGRCKGAIKGLVVVTRQTLRSMTAPVGESDGAST